VINLHKAMTARLDEDRMRELEDLSQAFPYGFPKSKVLRMCVVFTYQCFKKCPKEEKAGYSDVMTILDQKFKTKVEAENIRY
jgi:hypothetical protein